MSLIKRMRRQKAIYWAKGEQDHHGRYSYADPVEIDCRWEDGISEFRTMQGISFLFQATVYVDRQVYIGDILKKGEIITEEEGVRASEEDDERITEEGDTRGTEEYLEVTNLPADPSVAEGALVVQKTADTPNMRASETLHVAYL